MALPPIISNLPIFKLFKSAPSSKQTGPAPAANSTLPKDVVELSDAAKKRLEGVQTLSLKNDTELRETLGQTRSLLSEHQVSLGLDPSFS